MKIAQSVRLGAWLLIGFNLLMALGCVWIFMRMSPAIEVIIQRNARSLEACADMLACLALNGQGSDHESDLRRTFVSALNRAQNNVTEPEEPSALEFIETHYEAALKGDPSARGITVSAVTQLGEINRKAMTSADLRAQTVRKRGCLGGCIHGGDDFSGGTDLQKNPFQESGGTSGRDQRGHDGSPAGGPDAPMHRSRPPFGHSKSL